MRPAADGQEQPALHGSAAEGGVREVEAEIGVLAEQISALERQLQAAPASEREVLTAALIRSGSGWRPPRTAARRWGLPAPPCWARQ